MTAHEKAMLTYKEIEKRRKLKKQQEMQKKADANSTGWNGYTRFMVREQKKYY